MYGNDNNGSELDSEMVVEDENTYISTTQVYLFILLGVTENIRFLSSEYLLL
jgi:hypothetical protein